MRLIGRGYEFELIVFGALAVGLLSAGPALSAPSETPLPRQDGSAPEEAENNGEDFTRPLTLLQLRYQYRRATGSGAAKETTREVVSNIVGLRADGRIDLTPSWTLALRGDLPTVAKNPVTADNPGGDYRYGVGDVDFQAALVRSLDARWAAGAGVRIIAPTGADQLGGGKWRALWAAGVRYMLPEIGPGTYFVPQIRYDISFAGDPARRRIKTLEFMPTLNVELRHQWFVTLYPSADIRVNYGDPLTGQKGRLFLPFDALIGRPLSSGVVISLEIGVPIIKDYPLYDFKAQARLNVKF